MTRTELVRQTEAVSPAAWDLEQKTVGTVSRAMQPKGCVRNSIQNMETEDRRKMELEQWKEK